LHRPPPLEGVTNTQRLTQKSEISEISSKSRGKNKYSP